MPGAVPGVRQVAAAGPGRRGADEEGAPGGAALVSRGHRQRSRRARQGVRQALMRSRLDRCDAEHAPAYLESSNPDNVPYYQRFGFEVTGEITLPDGGPEPDPDVARAALTRRVAQPETRQGLTSSRGAVSSRSTRPAVSRDHLERLAVEDRALAPDALLGHVEHPVQPHPARPALVVPAAAADRRPSRGRRGGGPGWTASARAACCCHGRPPAPDGPCRASGRPRRPPRSRRSRRGRPGRRGRARRRPCAPGGRSGRCPR